MKKYWALIRVVFLDQIEYPANFYYWLILSLFPLFVMSYLWLSVFRNQSSVAGFSLSSMITYYFLTLVISRLNSYTAFWLSDIIREGRLSAFLLQPINFLAYLLTRVMSRKFITFIISLPLILFVTWLLKDYLILPVSGFYFLAFLLNFLFSLFLFAFLGFILGLVSLWITQIGSLVYFYYTLLSFLGGSFLPLSFFPETFSKVLTFLPFNYLYYFPILVWLGKVSPLETYRGLSISFIWLMILYFIYKSLWSAGLRRWESYGG